MRQQGITILAYPELVAADPLCQRKCYEMQSESMVGMPNVTTQANRLCEQYVQQVWNLRLFRKPSSLPWIKDAMWGSALCAMSMKIARAATDYTGVIPSHRRRGIATALKLCCIQYAKAHNVRTIVTGNDETNLMYQLNLTLGFKPTPAEVVL